MSASSLSRPCAYGGGFFPLFLFCLALSVSSCSSDPPEILASDARVLLVQDQAGGFSERLSVFVLFKSGEDPSNFGSLTVSHDSTGVEWNLEADRAVAVSASGGQTDALWIGSPAFHPVYSADGPGFPEGGYAVCVRDRAGNEAVSYFSLETPVFPSDAPVAFSCADDGSGEGVVWRVSLPASSGADASGAGGVFTEVRLFLLDVDGAPLYSFPVPSERFENGTAEGTRAEFEAAVRAVDARAVSRLAGAQCFAGNASRSAGVLLFPVSLGYDDVNE